MLSEETDVPVLKRLLIVLLEEIEISKRSYLWHGGGAWQGRYVRDGRDITEELLCHESDARKLLRRLK